MGDAESELIEQLKDVGNKLLLPPSSTCQLLDLLDKAELLLSKVGQSSSMTVLEALLLSMKALISDGLLRTSEPDVKISVVACLKEIMRISAPIPPYGDDKMKEIFELIVSSFDMLSSLSGRNYSKAVSILENVAKLQSCLMMLDLDCDPLIVKMFALFLINISADHPHSVFMAMVRIMSIVIKESDAVSLELVKVLLASIKQENQNVYPTSWKLGAKVFQECAMKLKPFIMKTLTAMGYCPEDYAPILSLMYDYELSPVENLVGDSAKLMLNIEPYADKTAVEHGQSLRKIERHLHNAVESSNFKALVEPGSKSGHSASKRGRKENSSGSDGHENWCGKGTASLGSPQDRLKISFLASRNEKTIPALEDVTSWGQTKEMPNLECKSLQQGTPLENSCKKKGRSSKNDVSRGFENKTTNGRARKNTSWMNDILKSQRKQTLDDDVIETPHGRKNCKDLVGCRIKVRWPLDDRYYEGIISSFNEYTKKHKVEYDDGDEEILNLRKERWNFSGERTF